MRAAQFNPSKMSKTKYVEKVPDEVDEIQGTMAATAIATEQDAGLITPAKAPAEGKALEEDPTSSQFAKAPADGKALEEDTTPSQFSTPGSSVISQGRTPTIVTTQHGYFETPIPPEAIPNLKWCALSGNKYLLDLIIHYHIMIFYCQTGGTGGKSAGEGKKGGPQLIPIFMDDWTREPYRVLDNGNKEKLTAAQQEKIFICTPATIARMKELYTELHGPPAPRGQNSRVSSTPTQSPSVRSP